MGNLNWTVVRYIPRYIRDFGSLLSGPKRFMARQNTTKQTAFARSLAFLGFSLVLVTIMHAPLLPAGKSLWVHAAATGVTSLLSVFLYAIALRIAWRLVGGRADVRSFFVTYAYFFGVSCVVLVFFEVLGTGFLKLLAPRLYTMIISGLQAGISDSTNADIWVSKVYLFIQLVGFAAVSIWCFVAWGAYRRLNDLSKWRSFFALLILGVLAYPLIATVVFFSIAIDHTTLATHYLPISK